MTLQTAAAATEPFVPGRARADVARKVILYGLIACVALLFFVPFLWTLITSFKTIPDSVNVHLIPHPWTSAAWRSVVTASSC